MDIKNVVVQNWYGWEGFGISCRWCMEPLNETPHELLNVEELLELVKAATHECAPGESFGATTTVCTHCKRPIGLAPLRHGPDCMSCHTENQPCTMPVHDDGPYRDPATGQPINGEV